MFYNTPRLPRALLHPLVAYAQITEPGPGGQFKKVTKAVSAFMGVVMPLSNKDWKPGQVIRDTYDGQRYTVKTELGHNSIHPMLRYIVEGVVGQ